jgi:hypothetical protein
VLSLREYAITSRGGSWPAGECLVFDPSRGEPVAVVREEPWPEVLERPWPDGVRGRPWLQRLLGVGRDPRRSRTVLRRSADGSPLVRLHRRQPLFHTTVGIFDGEDRRVGYACWPFKGGGPGDEFDLVGSDHRRLAEVRRAAAGAYRVAESHGGREWATVAVSRGGAEPVTPAACRVCRSEAAPDRREDGVFLLAAALVLFLPG